MFLLRGCWRPWHMAWSCSRQIPGATGLLIYVRWERDGERGSGEAGEGKGPKKSPINLEYYLRHSIIPSSQQNHPRYCSVYVVHSREICPIYTYTHYSIISYSTPLFPPQSNIRNNTDRVSKPQSHHLPKSTAEAELFHPTSSHRHINTTAIRPIKPASFA